VRLALDTNRYTDLMTADPQVVRTVEAASEILLPFPVLAELRAGFAAGTRRAANDRVLDAFLLKPFVTTPFADEQTVPIYATLQRDLRRRGRSIPHNDLWIAAICVQHAVVLFTRDKHFDYLPQVRRV
jgi:predicted nucleic acid-binding protein